jgi:hypothetical protein
LGARNKGTRVLVLNRTPARKAETGSKEAPKEGKREFKDPTRNSGEWGTRVGRQPGIAVPRKIPVETSAVDGTQLGVVASTKGVVVKRSGHAALIRMRLEGMDGRAVP